MRKRVVGLLCCFSLLIGGCTSAIGTKESSIASKDGTLQTKEMIAMAEAKSPEYIFREKGIDENGVSWQGDEINWNAYKLEDTFKHALKEFNIKTTAKVFETNTDNLCYSPMSLYYALSLAAIGASGQTEQELLQLLGVSSRELLRDQCDKLFHLLYTDTEFSKIHLANSVWKAYPTYLEEGEEFLKLKESYIQDAVNHLFASIYQVRKDKADQKVSEWISKQTKGLLRNENNITDNADWDLSLVNTIYYRDEWIDKFNGEPEIGTFTKSNGETISCNFMNSGSMSGMVKETEQFFKAALPLKDSSMFFVLPKDGVTAQQLIQSEDSLREILDDEESSGEVPNDEETFLSKIIWRVPKFDYASSMNLEDQVKELGVISAFENINGFSNMTDDPISFNSIIQETKVSIDENGAEAAGYTQITLETSVALPEKEVYMNLDRPFIYGIQKNGHCLFLGVCEEPTVADPTI